MAHGNADFHWVAYWDSGVIFFFILMAVSLFYLKSHLWSFKLQLLRDDFLFGRNSYQKLFFKNFIFEIIPDLTGKS